MSDPVEVMAKAGIAHYSEGGCSGLADYERREVVTDIITAALSALDDAGFAVVPKALLGGVVDSLRAASFEYEERDLYPGAVKIMSAQIAMLSAAQVKP